MRAIGFTRNVCVAPSLVFVAAAMAACEGSGQSNGMPDAGGTPPDSMTDAGVDSPTAASSSGSSGGAAGSSGGSAGSSGGGGSSSGGSSDGGPSSASSGAATTYSRLPDTSEGSSVSVYAFSDQPAASMPADNVVRFGASHYAGVQKMLAAAKALFVAYNANWVQLHYRLGAASGPVPFIHLDSWDTWPGTEWSALLADHPDYFLLNGSGMMSSYDSVDNWYSHDLTNAGMHSWWIDQTITDIQDSDSDGVFADSFDGAVGCAMTTTCDPRLAGTGATDPAQWANGYTYGQQMNDWVGDIQTALHAQPGTPLFVPNLGSLNTEWFFNQFNFTQLDGAFLESFPTANEDPYDNNAADNYALQMAGANKFVIIQTYPDPTDMNTRMFVVGTYLLIKGTRTFLNMAGGSSDTGFFYYPEYTVKLGSPVAPPPAQIGTLMNASGVYERDFENGMVLVNGSASAMSASLPAGKTLYQVTPAGGGGVNAADLDAMGNLAADFMSLSTSAVSGTIMIPAWSGAILLNASL
jgi:hypothetical protein